MNDVFITSSGTFLPNKAISNQEMEAFLGRINGKTIKNLFNKWAVLHRSNQWNKINRIAGWMLFQFFTQGVDGEF